MENRNSRIKLASLMLALGVAAGAFGAHALRERIGEHLLGIWEKGVLYHLIHAVALILLASLGASGAISEKIEVRVFWILFTGIVFFSGSLYLLSSLGTMWLGAVTPIGGVLFMLGWCILAFGRAKN